MNAAVPELSRFQDDVSIREVFNGQGKAAGSRVRRPAPHKQSDKKW